jgi:signal transduction histidine kinase
MRLIEKIILLLLGVSLLPLVVVGSLLYFSSKTTLQSQTTEQLSSVATVQEHRLNDIRSQNFKRLADFNSRELLRTLLDTYNRTGDEDALAHITTSLNDAKRLGGDIRNVTIVNKNGGLVASTEKETVVTQQLADELFKQSINQNSVRLAFKGNGDEAVFYLSGPLEYGGNKIGVSIIEVSAEELIKTVTDYTGLGETGEIALGQRLEDGSFAYITPLRFDSQAANRTITDNALPMYKALTGEATTFSDIRDYRGHEVIAVTSYLEDSDWGLVVKIDRTEAFERLSGLFSQFILLLFIDSVLVVFASIAIARYVTQPILDIDEVAEQTAKGNLKSRVANISDDEIGNLAGTFNDMLDRLEELDKAKNDFVSLASHQLRTPLTATKWVSEELLLPPVPLSDERKDHYLRQIHASNERMIRLVNQLLDASRIGFGTLAYKPEAVHVDNVLKLMLRDITPEIKNSGVKLETKLDKHLPVIHMDRTWVQVILQNLVSNALRYSKPGQSVIVSITNQNNEILIKVKDSGCGIPAAQQSKIFTKLFRADNARLLVGEGSGLGLYITKALVEQVGGKIWFESAENKGTTFYVKLLTNDHKSNQRGEDARR